MGSIGAWLFSCFLWFKTNMWGILRRFGVYVSLKNIYFGNILSFSSDSIDCLWMAPHTLVVILIRGLTFLRSWELNFSLIAFLGNLSWHYVNSVSCMFFWCVKRDGCMVVWGGAPRNPGCMIATEPCMHMHWMGTCIVLAILKVCCLGVGCVGCWHSQRCSNL